MRSAIEANLAIVGGEDAGHMIFLEHHKTGDGIIAAMQLIAAMLKEGKPLTSQILKDYYDTLCKMSVEDRMIKYNLREDRADVILPALQIYSGVMRWANINEIYVPKFGLVDGLIRNLYGQLVNTRSN